MDIEFWKSRWQNNQIGFHLSQVHPQLKRYFQRCLTPGPVLVPLCGKTLDMLFLAEQGCFVVGVEASFKAIEDFESGNSVLFQREKKNNLSCFTSERIDIYHSDFFKLAPPAVKGIHQVYDRAALIALPGEMRQRYVKHMSNIISRPLTIMLITLEYKQEEMQGPPFSVDENEIFQLYGHASDIERIHYNSIIGKEPHFQKKGLTDLWECVYRINFG